MPCHWEAGCRAGRAGAAGNPARNAACILHGQPAVAPSPEPEPLPLSREPESSGASAPLLLLWAPMPEHCCATDPVQPASKPRVKDTAPTGEAPAVPNPDSQRQAERISQIPQSGSAGSKLDAHQHRQQWDTASTVITTRSSLERCGDCHEALTPTMYPKSTQMSPFFHSPGWM